MRIIGRAAAAGIILLLVATTIGFTPSWATADTTGWTRIARIATPWDYPPGTFQTWEDAVDQAVADGANVILNWHEVSGNWQALYEPALSEDLVEMEYHANYIHTHHPGARYIIYVAPFEYVTSDIDTNGDCQPEDLERSLAVQQPDWAQVGIDGRPAIFYGGDETWGEQCVAGIFWIPQGAEDVWVTPANTDYRALILGQARQIAATGIDGVWFDVPFLRFDFGGNWQEQWPSFDPWAQEQFQAETGHVMPTTPDWDNPAWRALVRWRYTLTSDFIDDYRAALQRGNPNIKLIIESSVGPDVSSTRTGSSSLDLPEVSDLTVHEHAGPWQSADTHYYMWLRFLADLLFWCHTDGNQPAWLLSYVKAGELDTLDVARLHAALVLTSGMNYYTSGNEGMSGVPDVNFRRQLFAWLDLQEPTYHDSGWEPYANVALVYSQQSLDYLDRGNWESPLAYHDGFPGMAMILLESHIPFQLLSERELERLFDYDVAILPLFVAMSPEQAELIGRYVTAGGKIIATGQTSLYDQEGVQLEEFQLSGVFGVHYSRAEWGQVYVSDYGAGRAVFTLDAPELEYFWAAEPWDGGTPDPMAAEAEQQASLTEVWSQTEVESLLSITAPRGVILLPYRNGDELAVRALNFHGVDYGDALPMPITVNLTLRLPSNLSPLAAERLEFLGGWQPQTFAQPTADRVQMSFPLSIHAVAKLELGEAHRLGLSYRTDRPPL